MTHPHPDPPPQGGGKHYHQVSATNGLLNQSPSMKRPTHISPAYPAEVWERAKPIRLLLLDVDGVLTDGRLYFGPTGETHKVFHVRDGQGIKMLQQAGIEVAFLSGRRSDAAYHRAMELGITRFYESLRDKVPVLEELIAELQLTPREVAAVGDELVDLPLLARVGLAVAVADAPLEVQAAAHFVTACQGGQGAVREVCDLLLKAQGRWDEILRPWRNAGEKPT
jgi:3-deoxy-D-manno-octulosonate 8-phosphate phosphatase (KDO 8-P phosphatase)